jgi:hypothetical protein
MVAEGVWSCFPTSSANFTAGVVLDFVSLGSLTSATISKLWIARLASVRLPIGYRSVSADYQMTIK